MSVFRIKTGSEETYKEFNTPSINKILVDHLIQYDDVVKIGEPVFFLFGGDGTPWENGLAGICKIASTPLELGYETAKNGKYYKLELEIVYRLKTHMTKMDFSKYPETFDTGIGPSTKGERNQALGVIENKKAVASLCRALMDKDPEISNCILSTFGDEIFNFAKQNTIVYINPSDDSKTNTSNISQHNFSQIIYYGVPGSGKSHKIDEKTKDLPEDQKMRVVFHPEYTNADFVGQILPLQAPDGIAYLFKAGPFSRILKRALKNPDKPYYLIIEEINRGNAAAIFGDLFQLLDRNSDGWSSYSIENMDINAFIRSSDDKYSDKNAPSSVPIGNITFTENTSIRLPPNLSLFATMNTSDQNVFTLDNAFQRRWDMKLVENKFEGEDSENQRNAKIGGTDVSWGIFQTHINKKIGEISSSVGMSSMEDKRLGCWFVKADSNENGSAISKEKFAEKVLKYLWDDAFKFNREEIFDLKDKTQSLERIVQDFKAKESGPCDWSIFKDTSFVQSANEQ